MPRLTAAMLVAVSWPLFVLSMVSADYTHKAVETHMFSIPISPNMFNWTYQEFDEQYRFRASLVGKPELPSWLRYLYSSRHHAGFIFGTPPRGAPSPVTLEVVGLNRQDYETRRIQIQLIVQPLEAELLATHQLQLKIDNLNVEDLLDQHRMERLKEIFTMKLWPESASQLDATFLSSAVDLGARLPLRPNEGEGLVVRLGSGAAFSETLLRLRDEVQPLSRLSACPREFKRTTVERHFRLAAFTLDWCSFQLYEVTYTEKSTELREILDVSQKKPTDNDVPDHSFEVSKDYLVSPSKEDINPRSYVRELLSSLLCPLLLMLVPASALTVSLCRQHVAVGQKAAKVEMCRYETEQSADTENYRGSKSAGVSPNNSLNRLYSPKSSTNLAGNYNRPQPPPYLGTSSSTVRKTSPARSHSPEHNRTFEESLKLLNEAKIGSENDFHNVATFRDIPKSKSGLAIDPRSKLNIDNLKAGLIDPDLLRKSASTIDNARLTDELMAIDNGGPQIIDPADGMDDYVPIRPDGYVVMKPDIGYVTVTPRFGLGNGCVDKSI